MLPKKANGGGLKKAQHLKHLCWGLFLNKVAGWRPVTLLKKRLQHRCFPVNLRNFKIMFFTDQFFFTASALLVKFQIFFDITTSVTQERLLNENLLVRDSVLVKLQVAQLHLRSGNLSLNFIE